MAAKQKVITDWDTYYDKPYKTASFSRGITRKILISIIKKYGSKNCSIAELGGANSCFMEEVIREIKPSCYCVVDSNDFGLKKTFSKKLAQEGFFKAINGDVLNLSVQDNFDVL